MIPGFGAHYRVYRLVVALDRLGAMPPGTTLSMSKAAHLLGTSEKTIRQLLQRFEPAADTAGEKIDARVLRRIIRKLYETRKQH